MYLSILRAAGNALTASLISVLVCVLDAIFNFFLINPTDVYKRQAQRWSLCPHRRAPG